MKDKVYEIVKNIPFGKIMTYSGIAEKLGNKKLSRIVGNILHKNPSEIEIPCYKVVNREGKLSESFAFGGILEQKKRLEKENIVVTDNKVDLEKYEWK